MKHGSSAHVDLLFFLQHFCRVGLSNTDVHICMVLYCYLENPQIHLIYHYEFNEPQFGSIVTECGRTVTFMLKRSSFLWSVVCNVLNIQRVFIYCKYVICKKHKCLYMCIYICVIIFLSLIFAFHNMLCVYIYKYMCKEWTFMMS
jgi:hypothetical protein